jgi:hypothetical protein
MAAVDRTIVTAGFAIVALLIVAAAVPFRVFYDARNLHRFEIGGERCYEVGRRDNEVRVFCPDVDSGSPRLRIRTVPAGTLGAPLEETPGAEPLSPYARVK